MPRKRKILIGLLSFLLLGIFAVIICDQIIAHTAES